VGGEGVSLVRAEKKRLSIRDKWAKNWAARAGKHQSNVAQICSTNLKMTTSAERCEGRKKSLLVAGRGVHDSCCRTLTHSSPEGSQEKSLPSDQKRGKSPRITDRRIVERGKEKQKGGERKHLQSTEGNLLKPKS